MRTYFFLDRVRIFGVVANDILQMEKIFRLNCYKFQADLALYDIFGSSPAATVCLDSCKRYIERGLEFK
jgi:hypothetical protein